MIQVYTGNGKGKTTAALGLALRATGAGLKVYIGQFIKNGSYCEVKALKKIKNIKFEQFGLGCFFKRAPGPKDLKAAQKGLDRVAKIVGQKKYDIIILDEINVALKWRLIELNEVIEIVKKVTPNVELVLTGRNAHPSLIKMADLVSEIKDKKHYYKKGLKARRGIEF